VSICQVFILCHNTQLFESTVQLSPLKLPCAADGVVAVRAQHQPFNQALGRRQGSTGTSLRNPRGTRSSLAGAGRPVLQTTAGGSLEAYSM